MTYRTGRKVGRTIYNQIGPEPSDDDELVGLMDTPVLAALFVMAMNNFRANPGQTFVARPKPGQEFIGEVIAEDSA
jgi:hypothetical protein